MVKTHNKPVAVASVLHYALDKSGQCSRLERKSSEPMALAVAGGNVQAMQRLISDVVRDEDQMHWACHNSGERQRAE